MNHSFGDLHLKFWGCACPFYISWSTFTGVPPSKLTAISTASKAKAFSSILWVFRGIMMQNLTNPISDITTIRFSSTLLCSWLMTGMKNDHSEVIIHLIHYWWYMGAHILKSLCIRLLSIQQFTECCHQNIRRAYWSIEILIYYNAYWCLECQGELQF